MIYKKYFDYYSDLFNNAIEKYFPKSSDDYKIVSDAARYSLLNGGKRIRPLLMLLFSNLFGCDSETVLPFCVAIEMIHTYSLIHDDLPCMDNDDMRRGRPACHIEFGEANALLAGDLLLTESISVALKSNADFKLKEKALSVLASKAGFNGMIGGQVLDLSFEKITPSIEKLNKMYAMKTGALLSAAAEIGCILGGGTDKDTENASRFAYSLGLAFQIVDDILDVTGDQNLLGKPIGSDNDNNKTTYVTVYGLEKAKEIAKEITFDALNILNEFDADTTEISELTRFLLERKY